MLVTFRCKTRGDIIMFGDIAIHLLKLMGHSGTVPGAILAEDIPAALARLKSAVAAAGNDSIDASEETEEDASSEYVVSLAHRALPLIELLTAASSAKSSVMWDR